MKLSQLLALEEQIKADYKKLLDDRALLLEVGLGNGLDENLPDKLTDLMAAPGFHGQCYSLRQHLVGSCLKRLHEWFLKINDTEAADIVWSGYSGMSTHAKTIITRLLTKDKSNGLH